MHRAIYDIQRRFWKHSLEVVRNIVHIESRASLSVMSTYQVRALRLHIYNSLAATVVHMKTQT